MEPLREWVVESSELVFDNRWAKVRRDVCRLPNGSVVPDYYYYEGGDFAQVFVLTSRQEVVLVRQYKHGAREIVVELPAGRIETDDPDANTTAIREVREETGFVSDQWTPLGTLQISSAKATTRCQAFLATGATRAGDPIWDETEAIEVLLVPIDEVLGMIADGRICDTGSIAITMLALTRLGLLSRRVSAVDGRDT